MLPYDRKGKRPASAAAYLVGLLATSPLCRTAATPSQPQKSGTPGTFEIVGNSMVSAQQLFLGTTNKIYILDKTENNPATVAGHPAWAAEYDVNTNQGRTMDVVTNSFCAGGGVLANGTWVNIGGNQAVSWGGLSPNGIDQDGGSGPYFDADGGKSIRLLNPCDDGNCNWTSTAPMTTRRWYPAVETLAEGNLIVIGGNQMGGFVNSAGNNNPTYEFFPSTGDPIGYPLLEDTLPANLFALTWLLPSGNLLVQLNWATAILDYQTNTQYNLDNIPDAVRTYPASAGSVMLPLTPANNWTATVLFCGGSDLEADQWTQNWNIAQHPASSSCVRLTPDYSKSYVKDDAMPEGRTMPNLILLPDGRVFCVNGGNTGTAGYGNDTWAVGQSYADHPVMTPLMYDPSQPNGQRWSRDGLQASTIPRLYHSSATLLPDGSVFVTGSNPNADYTTNVKYATEYRVERFYPSYYSQRRPQPQGLPSNLTYGGNPFDIQLSKDDLSGNPQNLNNTNVVLMRTGFSTHAMNMGQRMLQLDASYTGNSDGSGTLHVSQVPPNPAVFAPGPALMFVVVNGVPSVATQVMIGSGQLGKQPVQAVGTLPSSTLAQNTPAQSDNGGTGAGSAGGALSTTVVSWRITLLTALFGITFALSR